jgi:hypothetical protein
MTVKSAYRGWCRNLYVRRVALIGIWTFLVPLFAGFYAVVSAKEGAVHAINSLKKDWEPEQ